jgi:hypothetical protein
MSAGTLFSLPKACRCLVKSVGRHRDRPSHENEHRRKWLFSAAGRDLTYRGDASREPISSFLAQAAELQVLVIYQLCRGATRSNGRVGQKEDLAANR